MAKFETISDYKNKGLNIPTRKTMKSAGYDFEVAEDIVIPSWSELFATMAEKTKKEMTLDDMAAFTKRMKTKPTLVPTGIKCQMADDEYLELSVRSSCPLKHWLIMGNSVGVIDADYYNNPDNEGHIYFQIINLSPLDIVLKKGDAIGQGIIKPYLTTEDDKASARRVGGFGSTDCDQAN